jgi:site-specific recombinase XerD
MSDSRIAPTFESTPEVPESRPQSEGRRYRIIHSISAADVASIPSFSLDLPTAIMDQLPRVVTDAGPKASYHFFEFFTAGIANDNTRRAYMRAVGDFLQWCHERKISLHQLTPIVVAAYLKAHPGSPQSVKQSLAALRMLFDHLVLSQVVPLNPAAAVRGPKYVIKIGKTPVLAAAETRRLLDSIDCSSVVGLRDRALIALMVYSFARIGAAVKMNVDDYYPNGKTWWIRLHEKGGKFHAVPVHHNAEAYLDAYLEVAGIADEKKSPLFRTTVGRSGVLTANRLSENDALRMIKRRCRKIGLPENISCHTFRATGITTYLQNGGTIEQAQQIAAHESPRTTKLYDRTSDEITLDEVERIII